MKCVVSVLGLGAMLTACGSVDFDEAHPASYAIKDTENTRLGDIAARLDAPQWDGQTTPVAGFYPVVSGIEALSLRLALAEMADSSIDLQYYLIKDGIAGPVLVGALLRAADRGVRVRIQLDDIFTKGYDNTLMALEAHPNIQIRLFNPFSNRSVRAMDLHRMRQLNRRLHNKSFTVDGQFTVIGGRNIADEYFAAREDSNFQDVDVLGVGPIVDEVADMFDLYWNSAPSIPVSAVTKAVDEDDLDTLRAYVREVEQKALASSYGKAVEEDAEALLDNVEDALTWAPYSLIFDSPDKALLDKKAQAETIVPALRGVISEAQEQLIVVTPYFILMESGFDQLQELTSNNVRVTIITNSYKSNNHSLVHAGYASQRKAILRTGATLHEAKFSGVFDETKRWGIADSGATLHSKLFFLDEDTVFVGSFNFDPRSANLNTELGVVIYSEEVAKIALEGLEEKLNASTYEVQLTAADKLVWVDRAGTDEVVFEKEPETSWWGRTKIRMLGWLPVRSQL